jgi:hypothetical protein
MKMMAGMIKEMSKSDDGDVRNDGKRYDHRKI